jgi:hypothetical protein
MVGSKFIVILQCFFGQIIKAYQVVP